MSLKESAARWWARRYVSRGREGKEGKDVQKVFAAIDGWKRIIVLVLALAQLLLVQQKGIDIGPYLSFVYGVLQWSPTDLIPVPLSTLSTTLLGLWAIVDGVKKALPKK